MNIIKTGRKTGCARQAIWPNRAAQNVFFVEALVCPINHPLTHILSLPYPYTFPLCLVETHTFYEDYSKIKGWFEK